MPKASISNSKGPANDEGDKHERGSVAAWRLGNDMQLDTGEMLVSAWAAAQGKRIVVLAVAEARSAKRIVCHVWSLCYEP